MVFRRYCIKNNLHLRYLPTQGKFMKIIFNNRVRLSGVDIITVLHVRNVFYFEKHIHYHREL